MLKFIRNYWLSVIWAGLIFYGCAMPADTADSLAFFSFPHMDKVVHAMLHFIFIQIILFDTHRSNFLLHNRNSYFISVAIAVFLGGLIELLQGNVFESRSGDWVDFMANTAGAAISAPVFKYFSRKILVQIKLIQVINN